MQRQDAKGRGGPTTREEVGAPRGRTQRPLTSEQQQKQQRDRVGAPQRPSPHGWPAVARGPAVTQRPAARGAAASRLRAPGTEPRRGGAAESPPPQVPAPRLCSPPSGKRLPPPSRCLHQVALPWDALPLRTLPSL